jgi:hypothetical protein
MCGRSRSATAPFNDVHVVPQWILRRYDMHNQRVNLSNGKTVRYDRFTVQCCADCNSDLGRLVEEPFKDLLSGGYDSLVAQMSETVRARLYCWCALLFLKMHLKDRDMRMHPDRRKGDAKIGDVRLDTLLDATEPPVCRRTSL